MSGWEETDDARRSGAPTSAMDIHHMEQVKSVLEHTHSITRMAVAAEVGISTTNVYCILTSSLGRRKVCAKWIPHVLNDNQTAMHVLATARL